VFVVYALSYLRGRRIRDAIGAAILLAGFVVESVLTLSSSRADATPWRVIEQIARTGGFFETRWLVAGNPDLGFAAFAGLVFLLFLLGAGSTSRFGGGGTTSR
jgi:hypothetical protein